MARPKCCRRVGMPGACAVFKPAGTPLRLLEEIALSLDELEALRLADLNRLSHEAAAESMGVSRQTFGRIVAAARKKTAMALTAGKALSIGGGIVRLEKRRLFACKDCCTAWERPAVEQVPDECPVCGSMNVCRKHRKPGAVPPASSR